jgi:hypothetical protein
MSPRRNWDSPNPSLASQCATPPRNGGGGGPHSRVGAGWGVFQFQRLEKRLSTLPTTVGGIICDHRLGRVLIFFSSRRNWNSPQPLTRRRMCPPPFGTGGRGTLAGVRGSGRVLIPTRGHTLWYSIYIYIFCVYDHLCRATGPA